METYTLKVTKGPGFPVKRVAVYNGLSPNEFAQLIGGALSIEYTKIVGLSVSGGGEVVPLSLACAMPALFADSTCIVLTSNKAGNLWALPQMAMRPLPAAQPEPPRLMSPAHYSASLSREKSRRFAMVAPAPSRYDLVAPAPLPPPPPPQQQQHQQRRPPPAPRYQQQQQQQQQMVPPPKPPRPPAMSASAPEYVPNMFQQQQQQEQQQQYHQQRQQRAMHHQRRLQQQQEQRQQQQEQQRQQQQQQQQQQQWRGGSDANSRGPRVTASPPHPEVAAKLQFVSRLEDQGLLSAEACAELSSALRCRDGLVGAAFDVGERTQDAKHLTKLLQDLSALRLGLGPGGGSSAATLTAMSEMVACAKDVARRAEFNESQYTQLANTALCYPAAAEDAYVFYCESRDPAAALNHLLHCAFGIDNDDDDDDDEEEEGEDGETTSEDDEAASVEEEEGLVHHSKFGESEVESVMTSEDEEDDDDDDDDEEDEDDDDEEEEDEYEAGKAPAASAGASGAATDEDSEDDNEEEEDDEDDEDDDEEEDEYEEDFEDETPHTTSDDEEQGAKTQQGNGGEGDVSGVGSELASILVRLESTLGTLQEHEAYVEKCVGACLEDAKKCLLRDDRDAAMECLKKKQMYEGKLSEIQQAVEQLQEQLTEAQGTSVALKAMYAQDLERTAAAAASGASTTSNTSSTQTQASGGGGDDEEGNSEDGDGGGDSPAAPRLTDLSQCVALMMHADLVDDAEGLLLEQLVQQDHFILKAAWEYYQVDPSLEELVDTILQLLKIETQRRSTGERAPPPAESTAAAAPSPSSAGNVVPPPPPPPPSAPPSPPVSADDDDEGADGSDGTDGDEGEGGGGGGLLDKVPPLFAKILIGALDVDILTKHQVVTFVEKFTSGDELVTAAWGIFEVTQDTKDLVNTLFKIYKVYQQKEAAEAQVKASSAAMEEQEAERGGDEEGRSDDDADVDYGGGGAKGGDVTSGGGGQANDAEGGGGAVVDAGMGQLMAILEQCLELLEKREEVRGKQALGAGSQQAPRGPALTSEAVACVKALGLAKDPLLIAVLADFSEKRDVDQLLDHLYVIALETQAGNASGSGGDGSSGGGGEGANDDEAGDDEAGDDDDEADEGDGGEDGESGGLSGDFFQGAQQQQPSSQDDDDPSSKHQLDVSEYQQKIMVIEAMLAENIVNELEKQALEVLVLKQDPEVNEAFGSFFGAQGPPQKLAALEQLSFGLKRMASQELDRLRAAITTEEEEGERQSDDDEGEGEENGGSDDEEEVRGRRGSVEMTAVPITEDEEESYEESEDEGKDEQGDEQGGSATDPMAAMTAALSSTLEHLGLPAGVKQALLSSGAQEREMIVAAIDVFQQTKDVLDLKDTLKRIARQFTTKSQTALIEARLSSAERMDAAHQHNLAAMEKLASPS